MGGSRAGLCSGGYVTPVLVGRVTNWQLQVNEPLAPAEPVRLPGPVQRGSKWGKIGLLISKEVAT
jgi:hypothetical protein